ncbi:MAG: hypothetical protein AAF958_05260 [Planctomycetota bacterium]
MRNRDSGGNSCLSSEDALPRVGMTLLEIILALTISAVVAVITLSALRRPTESATEGACTANRAMIQIAVDRFHHDQERYPQISTTELTTEGYWTGDLPSCPTRQQQYFLRSGTVVCPLHGS